MTKTPYSLKNTYFDSLVRREMATAESYAMVGGDGAQSYAKNSSYQV
ncbi:hypothetical protein Patl1_21388 [Pistacia atlantica]|uniref:Uncharacterized protein n=1 Tax=Pistacia atlantica TaxID=434234 RepID=A0ACC1BHU4_9ROSI|nr:hypothetical protein Patl1_21388 [Pistacia atlantica]